MGSHSGVPERGEMSIRERENRRTHRVPDGVSSRPLESPIQRLLARCVRIDAVLSLTT